MGVACVVNTLWEACCGLPWAFCYWWAHHAQALYQPIYHHSNLMKRKNTTSSSSSHVGCWLLCCGWRRMAAYHAYARHFARFSASPALPSQVCLLVVVIPMPDHYHNLDGRTLARSCLVLLTGGILFLYSCTPWSQWWSFCDVPANLPDSCDFLPCSASRTFVWLVARFLQRTPCYAQTILWPGGGGL